MDLTRFKKIKGALALAPSFTSRKRKLPTRVDAVMHALRNCCILAVAITIAFRIDFQKSTVISIGMGILTALVLYLLVDLLVLILLAWNEEGEKKSEDADSENEISTVKESKQKSISWRQHSSKGILALVCVAIFVVFVFFVWNREPRKAPITVQFPGYSDAYCLPNATDELDASKIDTEAIELDLIPGCRHGEYKLPENWASFAVQLRGVPGGDPNEAWVSIVCHGSTKPRTPPLKINQNAALDRSFDYCGGPRDRTVTFYAEGIGSLYFKRTALKR